MTGAAGGIGRAIAVGLAARGARVAVFDIKDPTPTAELIAEAGGEAIAVRGDITDGTDVDRLREAVHAALGGCEILVNNAANLASGGLATTTLEAWRRVLTVNLDGTFLMAKAFAPDMVDGGWGRIVNVCSASLYSNTPGLLAYMTSKAGLLGMTSSLVAELGPSGITVNAVSPAVTPTPGTMQGVQEGSVPASLFESATQDQAIRRPASAQDVVGPVAFLSSDDAYLVTGQFIVADGGRTRHF